MADQAKTGPAPAAPNASQQPIKPTDTKPAAAPIAAATPPAEPKKN